MPSPSTILIKSKNCNTCTGYKMAKQLNKKVEPDAIYFLTCERMDCECCFSIKGKEVAQ